MLGTSHFCQMINEIFDVCNSSVKEDAYSFKCALHPDSALLQLIDNAVEWLKNLQVEDAKGNIVNSRFKWLNGMIIALKSVKKLTFHLCETYGQKYLLTHCPRTAGSKDAHSPRVHKHS